MAKFSRDKGKRGELEVAGIIRELTGWDVKRRVRQHDGDSDLEGVPGWAIEVKNCATITLPAWWRQAVEQAGESLFPVLFYKVPRKGWRAMWPISLIVTHDEARWADIAYTSDTTIEGWAVIAREVLEIAHDDALDLKGKLLALGEAVH